MNLLMITGDRSLAAGKHGAFWSTLEELHKHFDRIDVICPNPGVRRFDMVVFGNVHLHPSPWPLVFQWFWIIRRGMQLSREQHPLLMTVHEYPFTFNGVAVRLLHQLTSIPYMVEVHHVVGHPHAAGFRELLGRWLTRLVVPWTTRYAVGVRVVNTKQAPAFLRAAGIPEQKIIPIPSAYIDLAVFRPQALDKSYDLIFVGRLARNKGLDLFLEVVRRTRLRALVVGEGPLMKKARRKAQYEKLPVEFFGFAADPSEVARLLNSARLLLMTSYNEGGPRIVLEAMACGVPVVATPVGIVADVLPPECIEEWSGPDLADKVLNILQDEMLYRRLSSQGVAVAGQFERVGAVTTYANALKSFAQQ